VGGARSTDTRTLLLAGHMHRHARYKIKVLRRSRQSCPRALLDGSSAAANKKRLPGLAKASKPSRDWLCSAGRLRVHSTRGCERLRGSRAPSRPSGAPWAFCVSRHGFGARSALSQGLPPCLVVRVAPRTAPNRCHIDRTRPAEHEKTAPPVADDQPTIRGPPRRKAQ
jgi:hypothetical protein